MNIFKRILSNIRNNVNASSFAFWIPLSTSAQAENSFNAYSINADFGAVINKIADYLSRANVYVESANGKRTPFEKINNPNSFETKNEFLNSIAIFTLLHGYCNVQLSNGLLSSMLSDWYVLNPTNEIWDCSTGKITKENIKDKIKLEYDRNGVSEPIDLSKVTTIFYKQCNSDRNPYVSLISPYNQAKETINALIKGTEANSTLASKPGGFGIISVDSGNGGLTMTADEKTETETKLSNGYGVGKAQSKFLVSTKNVKFHDMTVDSSKIGVKDIKKEEFASLCRFYGLSVDLFGEAKFENRREAEIAAYQNVVIPLAEKIATAIGSAIGKKLVFDFSHLPIFQKNKVEESTSNKLVIDSLSVLITSGVITTDEAKNYLIEKNIWNAQ